MKSAIIEFAKVGLFFDASYKLCGQPGSRCLELGSPSKRPFIIRQAEEADIDKLDVIESICWGHLRVTKSEIENRLRVYPAGQWVAVVDGCVSGIIYTQRVKDVDDIAKERSIIDAHGNSYPVLQLLTVSVEPQFSPLHIGSSLRHLVVLLGRIDDDINSIVAVTRCLRAASVLAGPDQYEDYVRNGGDATIQFHRSAGAVVLKILPEFRRLDDENFGCGVLIQYDIFDALDSSSEAVSGINSIDQVKSRLLTDPDQTTSIDSKTLIRQALLDVVKSCPSFISINSMDNGRLFCTSFMDLGLDSLQMMQLRDILCRLLDRQLPPTLLFDYPTPASLAKFLEPANTKPGIANDQSIGITKELQSSDDVADVADDEEYFAICGLACRFPGQTRPDPESFFEFLLSGESAVSSVPDDWKCKTRSAGFLDPHFAETFDPFFFGLTVAEAERMDPAQRILLEVCHEALQGAEMHRQHSENIAIERPRCTGVFVGASSNEWVAIQGDATSYSTTCVSQSIAANRISYCFNLTGPSLVVDTACSSSLTALHTACNSIRCGDCDGALVAAADLIISEYALEVIYRLYRSQF